MAECSLLMLSVLMSLASLAILSVLPHLMGELKKFTHHYEPYWGWQIKPAWVLAVLVLSILSGVGTNLLTRAEIQVVACGDKPAVVKVACR